MLLVVVNPKGRLSGFDVVEVVAVILGGSVRVGGRGGSGGRSGVYCSEEKYREEGARKASLYT